MSVARSTGVFCARTACVQARAPTAAAAHKRARLERFIHISLNNVRTQLIVVRPTTLRRGIQELQRIFPLAGKAIESAALQHVLGAFAGPDPVENTLTDFLHQVALRL